VNAALKSGAGVNIAMMGLNRMALQAAQWLKRSGQR